MWFPLPAICYFLASPTGPDILLPWSVHICFSQAVFSKEGKEYSALLTRLTLMSLRSWTEMRPCSFLNTLGECSCHLLLGSSLSSSAQPPTWLRTELGTPRASVMLLWGVGCRCWSFQKAICSLWEILVSYPPSQCCIICLIVPACSHCSWMQLPADLGGRQRPPLSWENMGLTYWKLHLFHTICHQIRHPLIPRMKTPPSPLGWRWGDENTPPLIFF